MRCRLEVVADVELDIVAIIRLLVFKPELLQMPFHSLDRMRQPFASLAREVVIDERLSQLLIEPVVEQRPLDYTISEPGREYRPRLWVIDLEDDVVLQAVFS